MIECSLANQQMSIICTTVQIPASCVDVQSLAQVLFPSICCRSQYAANLLICHFGYTCSSSLVCLGSKLLYYKLAAVLIIHLNINTAAKFFSFIYTCGSSQHLCDFFLLMPFCRAQHTFTVEVYEHFMNSVVSKMFSIFVPENQ